MPAFVKMLGHSFNKCSAVAGMGDRLVTIDMDRKLGAVPLWGRGAGSPSNTLSPGPKPTSIPSGILIYPTVWPQYTNVKDRTDRQWSDSIGRTVLQTVAQKAVTESGTGVEEPTEGRERSPFLTGVRWWIQKG